MAVGLGAGPAPGGRRCVSMGAEEIPAAIRTLSQLREAEAECTRCDLYRNAARVVPGEGPGHARFMLVGRAAG